MPARWKGSTGPMTRAGRARGRAGSRIRRRWRAITSERAAGPFMVHGFANLVQQEESEPRGSSEFFSTNMFMIADHRRLGDGKLGFHDSPSGRRHPLPPPSARSGVPRLPRESREDRGAAELLREKALLRHGLREPGDDRVRARPRGVDGAPESDRAQIFGGTALSILNNL